MVDFGTSFLAGITGGATVAIIIKAIDNFSNNFKKATTGINAMKVAAGVALAGVVALGTGITKLGISSIQVAKEMIPIRRGFQRLTKDSDIFLKELNDATKGTVSNFELMAKANNALLLGIDQEALPSLFRNAAIVGRAAGRTTTEAINDITVGIGRQSRLILDNLGIIVKAEEAYEDYAKAIGKSASELTLTEQRTAFTSAAIDSLEEKARNLGGTLDEDATTAVERFNAQWRNMKEEIGEALLPTFTELVNMINKEIIPAFKKMTPEITQLLKDSLILAKESLPTLIELFKLLIPILREVTKFLSAMLELFRGLNDAARQFLSFMKELGTGFGRGLISFASPLFGTGNIPGPVESTITRIPARRSVVNVSIENVNGLDAENVSRSLREELQTKISL